MTAEEFLEKSPFSHYYDKNQKRMVCFADDVQKIMIEFAKHHVENALQAARKDAQAYYNEMKHWHSVESITKAYPLNNIV